MAERLLGLLTSVLFQVIFYLSCRTSTLTRPTTKWLSITMRTKAIRLIRERSSKIYMVLILSSIPKSEIVYIKIR